MVDDGVYELGTSLSNTTTEALDAQQNPRDSFGVLAGSKARRDHLQPEPFALSALATTLYDLP
jgi:hypothetical protein